jgi:PAS domain S-box-containing protein
MPADQKLKKETFRNSRPPHKTPRESEELFQDIFKNAPIGIGLVKMDFRIFQINRSFCEMMGYTEQELKGRTFVEITHPEDIDKDVGQARRLFNGDIRSYKLLKRYIKKDGGILWGELTATVIRDEHGRVLYALALVENMTERRRAEEFQKLSRRIVQAQEAERRRLARELHDGVNQILTFTKLRSQTVVRELSRLSPGLAGELRTVSQYLKKAMEEIRRISRNLGSTVLEDLGFGAAVQSLCDELEERTGAEVRVKYSRWPRALPPESGLVLYRILQEALTNVERHSSAEKVAVRFEGKAGSLRLSIQDNGKGFQDAAAFPKNKKGGLGLRNMQERAQFAGGTLAVRTALGWGTEIVAQIPWSDRLQERMP